MDQAIVCLNFLRVSSSLCSSSSVSPSAMMIGFPFSGYKKAYFKCPGNSLRINPFELVFSSAPSSL